MEDPLKLGIFLAIAGWIGWNGICRGKGIGFAPVYEELPTGMPRVLNLQE
jgi:hypothetical protein